MVPDEYRSLLNYLFRAKGAKANLELVKQLLAGSRLAGDPAAGRDDVAIKGV